MQKMQRVPNIYIYIYIAGVVVVNILIYLVVNILIYQYISSKSICNNVLISDKQNRSWLCLYCEIMDSEF